MASVDLSVLVAAHREGNIAHKTLLSIKDALEVLRGEKVSYEVLVHIDNGDQATKDYFKNQNVLKASVHENTFGDLGDSRNYSIEKAKGEYVAIVDADDLVSPNWFSDALRQLKAQKEDVVVHTQYSVNFGEKNIIWPKTDSKPVDEERLIQVSDNRWDSAIVAKRSLMLENPYTQMSNSGFAPEDWHFNSETLNKGIPHLVAPKTTLFVRRKPESVMTQQAQSYKTMRYTDLLDVAKVQAVDSSSLPAPKQYESAGHTAQLAKKVLKTTRRLTIKLGKEFGPTRKIIANMKASRDRRNAVQKLEKEYVPEWLHEQWREIHRHERNLFPSKKLQDSLLVYHSDHIKPRGWIYKRIVDALGDDHIDHIIFAPWLIHGGGDLVTIRYANTLAKQNPNKRIAVFTTEDAESPWAKNLESNVDFIEYGKLTKHITDEEQLKLLARVVVQAKVKSIQIINSRMAYSFLEKHKDLVRSQKINVYTAAFCQDVDEEGREGGYIHTHLPKVYDTVTKILSENQYVIDKLVDEYGMNPKKFAVHYQPAEKVSAHWENPGDNSQKLIWASRISLQKRPDLVVAVARELQRNHPEMVIEAYGTIGKNFPNLIENAGLDNLKYMGGYNGVDSLPWSDYRGYIYTSDYDGMPNAVLGAVGVGIPVIASDVGGIGEILEDKKNGYLVENNPEAFAEAIGDLLSKKPADVMRMVKRGQEKLDFQHNQEAYEKAVAADIPLK